jgi:hypothetical protein
MMAQFNSSKVQWFNHVEEQPFNVTYGRVRARGLAFPSGSSMPGS